MKYSTYFVGALLLILACDSVNSTEQLPPEELVLGSWQVSFASIDGQVYPVTTPGFGQMQAIIDENVIQYIYPRINDQGIPTSQNDTLMAGWSFNDDHTVFNLINPSDGANIISWNIMNLSVGLLQTSYEAQSPNGNGITSTYNLTYRLRE